MSHGAPSTFNKLSAIAHDLYEVFDAEGYTISEALRANCSFGRHSRRSQSSLGRDLALDAIMASAARESVPVANRLGGTELQMFEGSKVYHYRLLKGGRTSGGEWRIIANSKSALTSDDTSGLFADEFHVFSWSTNDDNTLSEVVTARVRDHVEGNPGYLVLDQLQLLGSGPTPGSSPGFVPTDDDLPGFEEDQGDDSASGTA